MVPLSGEKVGGALVLVPSKVSENVPVTAIAFPLMTPVKLIVSG